MKCKHILAALGCALLALSTVGCGAFKGKTSDLKTITLGVSAINGTPVSGQGGVITLQGLGGTLQLQATGEYTGGTTQDLTHVVTYSAVIDPEFSAGIYGELIPPCQPPACPNPSQPPYTSGTLEFSQTGLVTAVEPANCTWVNSAVDPATTPAWAYEGDYIITASYQGVISQPIYVPIASAPGIYDADSNPSSACGPSGS